jgi:hypothetical protein
MPSEHYAGAVGDARMDTMLQRLLVLVAVGLPVALAGAGYADHRQATNRASVGHAPFHCPVTVPNAQAPPGESRSPSDFGNGRLWTLIPVDGKLAVTMTRPPPPGTVPGELHRDGSMATKFPWWGARSARRELRITGRRLDARVKPLRANVAPGLTHGPHF